MFGSGNKKLPLSEEDIAQLQERIRGAETLSSAQFKIIVIKHSTLGLRSRAIELFKKYHLAETSNHNAVLILVDSMKHKIMVYADEPAYKKIDVEYWHELSDLLNDIYNRDNIYQTLCSCIKILAHHLPIYYPPSDDDTDEISNDLIFED